jgi:hypothetical protein
MRAALCLLAVAAITLAYWIGKHRAEVSLVRPSATEIFNLRSECAKLAENIRSTNQPSPVLTLKLLSHYDRDANRCYTELSTEYATRLYDAQSGELLVESWNGVSPSFIKGGPEKPSRDAALALIERTMADDWKH